MGSETVSTGGTVRAGTTAGTRGSIVRAAVPATRSDLALRVGTALMVLVSAVVHVVLYAQGFKDIPVIGPLFLVNAVAGLVIAVALVLRRHWLFAFLAAGFGAATFGAYLVSKYVGLFGVRETTWTASAVVGAISEVAALVLGLVLLVRAFTSWRGRAGRAS